MNCTCDNEVCTCDTAVAADSPVVTYSQIALWIRIFGAITLAWAAFLVWMAYEVVTGSIGTAIQAWVASMANAIVSNLPTAPLF